jgi:hypothetical protein
MVNVAPVNGWVKVILFILVAVATPRTGVISVGVLAKTFAPLPTSSDNSRARLALVGVARNVAAPEAKPLIPVEIGRPVQLVRVPAEGMPMLGVIRTGLLSTTNLVPVPVCEVIVVTELFEVITPDRLVGGLKSGPPIGITLVAVP